MNKKLVFAVIVVLSIGILLTGCYYPPETSTSNDVEATLRVGDRLVAQQPTPTDINYSLERYNLIRRAYWVNGQREKAISYPCSIPNPPLGYIILITDNGSLVGKFVVEGKVSSLNSYLTPDSEFYEQEFLNSGASRGYGNHWIPDVDGSYGYNDDGIFFFTPDGKYVEWTGTYLYSDIPFEIADPVVKYKEAN